MENGNPTEGKDPSTFLSEITGAPVTVKLNSGVVYQGTTHSAQDSSERSAQTNFDCRKGELQSVDGYMNIALEKTEEYVNGQLRRSYGDAFVRGNNGMTFRTHDGIEIMKLTEDSTLYFGAIFPKLVS
jgi:small nuclear ribonucleoprotein (snRNP)-like protein